MDSDDIDNMFSEACLRLFELHADGYKRPRPGQKRKTSASAPAPTVQRTRHLQLPARIGASVV